MLDIDSITLQVKHNCDISDAKFWGDYSPCGLLLRLRDLYRTENGYKPHQKINNSEVGMWIEGKEEIWQDLENSDFKRIEIQGRRYSPFDVKGINSVLTGHGVIYAAGYGEQLKPLFILAELSDQSIKGMYHIYYTGRELARDLSTSPAMIQGNTILARTETAGLFLWNKFEEMKAQKCDGALFNAFSEYGISRDAEVRFTTKELERLFISLIREEMAAYVHHELGEASQRRMLGTWWKRLVLKMPYSRAELFLRSLKDVLSDTCDSGMLTYIIKNRKAGSLGFYVALLSGIRRVIFPDIVSAYLEFTKTQDWGLIENSRIAGYRRGGDYVRDLKALYDKGGVTQKLIEEELLRAIM
ncbi:MAG: Sfum_1244 family protein [Nitrospirota bacterium]